MTLSLPEPLLRRFRVYAAERNESMTSLMSEAIRKMMDENGEAERAKRRMIERMRNSPNRGVIPWNREEIYEQR